MAALEAGKHVLCEKPVAYDFRDTLRAAELADAEGPEDQARLHLPLLPRRALRQVADRRGLHRRAVHLQRLRAELAVDQPADAAAPGRSQGRPERICRSRRWRAMARRSSTSATGGSARTTRSVVGTMRNFVPERMVRATGTMMRMNIDDGDIFIGEFANGAIGSIQTSFVTVGNYPGIEARIYGEQGRDHLPPGRGVRRRRDDQGGHPGRRRVQGAGDPAALLPERRPRPRERGARLFYANLIKDFLDETRRPTRPRTRATSTTAPGSRRSSTPSRCPSTSAAGSTCRWHARSSETATVSNCCRLIAHAPL